MQDLTSVPKSHLKNDSGCLYHCTTGNPFGGPLDLPMDVPTEGCKNLYPSWVYDLNLFSRKSEKEQLLERQTLKGLFKHEDTGKISFQKRTKNILLSWPNLYFLKLL